MEINQQTIDSIRKDYDKYHWFSPSKPFPGTNIIVKALNNFKYEIFPLWLHEKCFEEKDNKTQEGWFSGSMEIFGFGHPVELVPNKAKFMVASKDEKRLLIMLDREAGQPEKGYIIAAFDFITKKEVPFSLSEVVFTPEPIKEVYVLLS